MGGSQVKLVQLNTGLEYESSRKKKQSGYNYHCIEIGDAESINFDLRYGHDSCAVDENVKNNVVHDH